MQIKINLKIVKGISWFFVMVTIALAFPLQVYFSSPYPSLLPYLLIGFIFLLSFLSGNRKGIPRKVVFKNKISLFVSIYVLLLLVNTFAQILFKVINFYDGISALVIYLLPVLLYWYFREYATDYEIRALLLGMVIASVVVGLYFAYDSYIKLALHKLTDYSVKASQYSTQRAGGGNFEDPESSRIAIGYRSFGLLETHAVSGGWVIIGCVAALALVQSYKKYFRLLLILFYGIMLLLGLNFTSIIAFLFIMFLFEFGGLSLLRLRFSYKILSNLFFLFLIFVILAAIPKFIVGDVMTEFIFKNIISQKDLALGGVSQDEGFVAIIIRSLNIYFKYVLGHPNSFFIGDGFSTYGINKGGDIGFVESMERFGFPFFVSVVFGFILLVRQAIRKMNENKIIQKVKDSGLSKANLLQFSASITLLVFISEIHYTIWSSKAVLPVVFFMLAMYDRFLSRPNSSLRENI